VSARLASPQPLFADAELQLALPGSSYLHIFYDLRRILVYGILVNENRQALYNTFHLFIQWKGEVKREDTTLLCGKGHRHSVVTPRTEPAA